MPDKFNLGMKMEPEGVWNLKAKRCNMSKISVIMPSLNVRAYIEKSLRSVMDQTLNDIDIICIDGGSKDGTLEIIEKLAESDSRIKVIHSGKRSYGYQVNQGIKAAEGEYIGIVETDDYIEKDMYKKLYESAADTSYPDIVKCNYNAYWIDRKGKLVFRRREIPKPHEFYRKIVNPLEQAFVPVEDWYLWNGIYKRSFINENDIVLSESLGAAFQDIGFLHRTNVTAHSALYIEDSLYNYCIGREGSSSNSGRELRYSYHEFRALEQEKWKEEAMQAMYVRMAKSFVCCCKCFEEKEIRTQEYRNRYAWFVNTLKKAADDGQIGGHNLPPGIWKRLQILLNSLDEVYRQYLYDYQYINAQAEEWKYVIFGCGERGQAVFDRLYDKRQNIVAFMDNDARLWGTFLEGIPIRQPQICEGDVKYIIGNEAYFDDIREQLLRLGVKKEDIGIFW